MPNFLFSKDPKGKEEAARLQVRDILSLERTVFSAPVNSKKKALEMIADTVALTVPSLRKHDIFDGLIARERLGSTAVGHGVALPHCRLRTEEVIGCFILLKEGIDFDAQDGEPVDLLFALLVPLDADKSHLDLLALLAEIFRKEDFRSMLRKASSREELFQRLIHA